MISFKTSEEGHGHQRYLEGELISPAMGMRVEEEKLRKKPNVCFEKLGAERKLLLRLEVGGEGAPWVWEVERRS